MTDPTTDNLRALMEQVAQKNGSNDAHMMEGGDPNDIDRLWFKVMDAADELDARAARIAELEAENAKLNAVLDGFGPMPKWASEMLADD